MVKLIHWLLGTYSIKRAKTTTCNCNMIFWYDCGTYGSKSALGDLEVNCWICAFFVAYQVRLGTIHWWIVATDSWCFQPTWSHRDSKRGHHCRLLTAMGLMYQISTEFSKTKWGSVQKLPTKHVSPIGQRFTLVKVGLTSKNRTSVAKQHCGHGECAGALFLGRTHWALICKEEY